ncbi:MAG: DeoR family transcriptional regulator [Candidatus Staskawiczbacteria bacterium]|nr:DeoR family transcriptional regulator [Candidatus Staskawiczbacteria bacterium]
MELTNRQQKILNSLISEYINSAEPVSSQILKEKFDFDCSGATIRNDLQDLTKEGYITQPHTSAGRIPTEKGYKFFIEITFSGNQDIFPNFIIKEIEETKKIIERELQMARELAKSLEEIHSMLHLSHHLEEDSLFEILKIVGPSRISYKKNINVMRELLEEFENL